MTTFEQYMSDVTDDEEYLLDLAAEWTHDPFKAPEVQEMAREYQERILGGVLQVAPTDETFSRDDIVDGVLNRVADSEAVGAEAVEMAIDATLSYVVEWLHERGNIGVAGLLEELGAE
jgi:hypothetical protein